MEKKKKKKISRPELNMKRGTYLTSTKPRCVKSTRQMK